MIADALRVEIDNYCARGRTNPLFLHAEAGTLGRDTVINYLVNIHILVTRTPGALNRARERSAELGLTLLEEHFRHKLREETGHDSWSESDIRLVSNQDVSHLHHRLLPSMAAIIDYADTMIEEDPATYLAHMLLVESVTVILGPPWIQLLEERCGISQQSMTIIGNHVELDREHVADAFDQIDDLVGDPRKLPMMRDVLRSVMSLFDRFCSDLLETQHESNATVAHVSAA